MNADLVVRFIALGKFNESLEKMSKTFDSSIINNLEWKYVMLKSMKNIFLPIQARSSSIKGVLVVKFDQ